MLYVVGPVSKDYAEYFAVHNTAFSQFVAPHKYTHESNQHPVDFSSAKSITASLQKLLLPEPPTAVIITGYEQYVWRAAMVAEYFGLPFCSPDAARRATDKTLMRQAFAAADPTITPQYAAITSLSLAVSFANEHGYPVMLKPANLMKSLFIHKCSNEDELITAFNTITTGIEAVYKQYRIVERPALIIEQFMEGTMHTVAGFADCQGEVHIVPGIADCLTAQQVGINDNYLVQRTLPSQLNDEQTTNVYDVAVKAVKALGLTSTPVHVELIYTASGPKIIEVGARLGGYRPRMYAKSQGVDLYGAALAIAHGDLPDLTTHTQQASAVLEFFPDHTGIFTGYTVDDSLTSYVSSKFEPGTLIGPAQDGYRAPLIGFVDTDTPEKTEAICRQLLTSVKINTSLATAD